MRALLASGLVVSAFAAHAQRGLDLRAEGDATAMMVRGYEGTEATEPALQATWRLPPDSPATFSYQRLSAPTGGRSLMLRSLLLAGIDLYLDQRVHFAHKGVTADASDERILADLNAMVSSAAKEFDATEGFSGFTEPTMEQLERVTHIDWSQATFGVDAGGDQDKYLAIYFYVRSQRQELARQLRADLLPLAGVDVLTPEPTGDAFSTGRGVQVPTVCSAVYDDQNFLCALDLGVDTLFGTADGQLTDELLDHLATKAKEAISDEPVAPASPEWQPKIRKRDRWLKAELDIINDRIDKLDQRKELWTLRDRMDDMEGRIDDIGLEVREIKEGDTPASENPLANLSDLTGRNITVRFLRNLSTLDAESRVMLNEVFEQLARAPQDRVLITGYTDRSGDAAVNLALSEQRAKTVRNYLLSRGIEPERLLVNYYGDSRSSGRDPNERRVEVEWLR
jgi:outer membrane protein OmpA-like peptidoglycan-associated protein